MKNLNTFSRWWLSATVVVAGALVVAMWIAASRQVNLCAQYGGVCENSLSHQASLGSLLVVGLLILTLLTGFLKRSKLMIVGSSILLLVGGFFAGGIALLIAQGA